MSLFQSALDFLAGPGSSGAASRDQNDFVGQVVELGDMKLRIKRVIAEGEISARHNEKFRSRLQRLVMLVSRIC